MNFEVYFNLESNNIEVNNKINELNEFDNDSITISVNINKKEY